MPEIPVPEYKDPKELYAFFGLAYYITSLLEDSVINLTVAMQGKQVEGICVGDLSQILDGFNKDTLGRVIHKARMLFDFSEKDEKDILAVLEKRNYLAHRFWSIHAGNLLTENGWKKMIDELVDIIAFVQSVDGRMTVLWKRALKHFGVTEEMLGEEVARWKAEMQC